MKTLKDLGLRKKTHKKVEDWLNEWLQMLIKNADGRAGTVYRADFENNDFFYFTDCRDHVSKEIEHVGREASRKIRIRKAYVQHQLLIKNMLGTLDLKKNKCSHCGHPERYTAALNDSGTYFHFCPKCWFTSIHTYPGCFHSCIDGLLDTIIPIYKKNKTIISMIATVRKNIADTVKEKCEKSCKCKGKKGGCICEKK